MLLPTVRLTSLPVSISEQTLLLTTTSLIFELDRDNNRCDVDVSEVS